MELTIVGQEHLYLLSAQLSLYQQLRFAQSNVFKKLNFDVLNTKGNFFSCIADVYISYETFHILLI